MKYRSPRSLPWWKIFSKTYRSTLPPYEPESLEELRDLRDEQRELRLDQRKIRSNLRKTRRSLVRADEDDEREELSKEIVSMEAELAEVSTQYDTLSIEIDQQYQQLRDYRDGYTSPQPPESPDLDTLIAQTACDYGATLKSLRNDEYLTIALRRGEANEYYAFLMEHVKSCSNQNMKVEKNVRAGLSVWWLASRWPHHLHNLIVSASVHNIPIVAHVAQRTDFVTL